MLTIATFWKAAPVADNQGQAAVLFWLFLLVVMPLVLFARRRWKK